MGSSSPALAGIAKERLGLVPEQEPEFACDLSKLVHAKVIGPNR
jgi:hypothetical protein